MNKPPCKCGCGKPVPDSLNPALKRKFASKECCNAYYRKIIADRKKILKQHGGDPFLAGL